MPSHNKKLKQRIESQDKFITKYDTAHSTIITKIISGLSSSIIEQLINIAPHEVKTKRYRDARLDTLFKTCFKLIDKSFSKLRDTIFKSVLTAASDVSRRTNDDIKAIVTVNISTKQVSEEYLEELASNSLIDGLTQREWWAKQSLELQHAFKKEMRQGLALGEDLSSLVRRIRGRRENQFKDGVMSTSTRNAEALARTSLQTVANQARIAQYEQHSDVLDGLELSVTMDSRLSKICQARRGLKYTLDKQPIGHNIPFGNGPPYHFNCRTQVIPILKPLSEI